MLSNDVVTRLRPHLEPVEFQRGEHLFQSDQQLGHAFFFNGGLSSEISVVTATKPLRSGVHRVGRTSEPAVLGVDSTPHFAFMQCGAPD